MGAAMPEPQSLSTRSMPRVQVVADVLVEEAGVEPMLHRSFVAPIVDGDDPRHRHRERRPAARRSWPAA
jgi:hypothetical protein